uniref:Uncharacterized protein n=1 Tax=Avena sativa TaxID=4498 RepID=A0ACD5X5D1_AVESA
MVWPASKQEAGGDRAEAKQHNAVKAVKSGTPISKYQFPFHSLSLNKVKNIEVDRLRLSFTTKQKPTLVPVDSDEESDDDQECADHVCSGLHAIPRKNRSRSTKKRVRKGSCKEFYKIFS